MISAFCIAAPHSGTGKTTLSAGLMRLFARTHTVQPFKCGPDYVDPSYHKAAAGQTSYNLDTWLMGEEEVKRIFFGKTQNCDIAAVEGVMGLFDGKMHTAAPSLLPNISGSTAHTAQLLNLPVLLIIDCKGMAQSVSALVRGFQEQCREYGLKIAGIIANNTGSERHAAILKESLDAWNLPPLLGHIPKNSPVSFKEHQLGLPHLFENTQEIEKKLDFLAVLLEKHIDIPKLLALTAWHAKIPQPQPKQPAAAKKKIMAVAYDKAFCFYYPQNLEALEQCGYNLQFFSPLKDSKLPKADAVYLGGGYPEIFAEELSQNTSMRNAIKNFAEQDGNIFAECGGFMYLCGSLQTTQTEPDPKHANTARHATQAKAQNYAMCGILNAKAVMGTRLRSLGYREGTFIQPPFFWQSDSTAFKGHEFHWSDIQLREPYRPFLTIDGSSAGIIYKNVYASYIHFYFGQLQ